jgi:hypothetical protein
LGVAEVDILAGSLLSNFSQEFFHFRVLLGKPRYLNSVQIPLPVVEQNFSSKKLPIACVDVCGRGEG